MAAASQNCRRRELNRVSALMAALCCRRMATAAPPTRPLHVSVSPDGRLLVNNRPEFFIALSPSPPVDLTTPEGGDGWAELRDASVSAVRGEVPRTKRWTQEARDEFSRSLDALHACGISTRLKNAGGKRVLLAASRSPKPAKVTVLLPGEPAGKARVRFEDRDVPVASGQLADEFKPYDVHVYELP